MPENRTALHAALCDGFVDFAELRYTIALELDDPLHSIAADLDLEAGAYKLIEWGEARGKTADLLAAIDARP